MQQSTVPRKRMRMEDPDEGTSSRMGEADLDSVQDLLSSYSSSEEEIVEGEGSMLFGEQLDILAKKISDGKSSFLPQDHRNRSSAGRISFRQRRQPFRENRSLAGCVYQVVQTTGLQGQNVLKLVPVSKPINNNCLPLVQSPGIISTPTNVSFSLPSPFSNAALPSPVKLPVLQQPSLGNYIITAKSNLPESEKGIIANKPSTLQSTTVVLEKSPVKAASSPSQPGHSSFVVVNTEPSKVSVTNLPMLPSGHHLQIPADAEVKSVPASSLPFAIKQKILAATSGSDVNKNPSVIYVSPVNTVRTVVSKEPTPVSPNNKTFNTTPVGVPQRILQAVTPHETSAGSQKAPMKWIVQENRESAACLVPVKSSNDTASKILKMLSGSQNDKSSISNVLPMCSNSVSPNSKNIHIKDNALVMYNNKIYLLAKRGSEVLDQQTKKQQSTSSAPAEKLISSPESSIKDISNKVVEVVLSKNKATKPSNSQQTCPITQASPQLNGSVAQTSTHLNGNRSVAQTSLPLNGSRSVVQMSPPLSGSVVQMSPPLSGSVVQTSPPLSGSVVQTSPPLSGSVVQTSPPLSGSVVQTPRPLSGSVVQTPRPLSGSVVQTPPPLSGSVVQTSSRLSGSAAQTSQLNGSRNVSQASPPLNGSRNVSQASPPLNGSRNVSQASPALNGSRNVSQASPPLNGSRNVSQTSPPLNGSRNVSQASPQLNGSRNITQISPQLNGSINAITIVPQPFKPKVNKTDDSDVILITDDPDDEIQLVVTKRPNSATILQKSESSINGNTPTKVLQQPAPIMQTQERQTMRTPLLTNDNRLPEVNLHSDKSWRLKFGLLKREKVILRRLPLLRAERPTKSKDSSNIEANHTVTENHNRYAEKHTMYDTKSLEKTSKDPFEMHHPEMKRKSTSSESDSDSKRRKSIDGPGLHKDSDMCTNASLPPGLSFSKADTPSAAPSCLYPNILISTGSSESLSPLTTASPSKLNSHHPVKNMDHQSLSSRTLSVLSHSPETSSTVSDDVSSQLGHEPVTPSMTYSSVNKSPDTLISSPVDLDEAIREEKIRRLKELLREREQALEVIRRQMNT
ncbi:ligand-dependent nuclear receptor-interacting factor 1 [Rhinophrynus dorsalis]